MSRQVVRIGARGLAFVAAAFLLASGSLGNAAEHVKPVKLTNLDENQEALLQRLERMYTKVYGLAELPDKGRDEVDQTFLRLLDGIHQAEPTRALKISHAVMEGLQSRQLTVREAIKYVRELADLLAGDDISQQTFVNTLVTVEETLRASRLGDDKIRLLRDDFEQTIRTAKRDDARFEAREKAREEARLAEEERKRKEEERKAEEERKKQERMRSSGGSSSGRRGS